MSTGYDTSMPRNYVLLAGTVHRDPAIHHNPQGNPMAVIDLRTQNPETGKENDFHNMVAFGGLAEWCKNHLQAGMRVCVQGQLALRRWKQGESWRSRPQVIVRQVSMAPVSSDWLQLAKLHAAAEGPLDQDVDPELGI